MTMKTTLLAVGLASLALAAPALAQYPGGGQGGPGGGGGFGGGRGGFGGGRPSMGKVTGVDPSAGTVTIAPQFGGGGVGATPQIIHIASGTPITTMAPISVADLKVGDAVTISTTPTGLTLTVGQAGGFGGGGRGGFRGGPGGQGGSPQDSLQATGKITAVSPTFTIMVGKLAYVAPVINSTTKIQKSVTLTVSGIKVGDTVFAMGPTGDDGSVTASMVMLNPDFGGLGGGGRGGFGGGGGRRGGGGGQGGFGGQNAPGTPSAPAE